MAAVLFDLDGVLYDGNDVIPGAPEAVAWFQAQGIPHLFVTNTSSKPRSALVEKLACLGIDVEPSRILTPAVAARRWLRETNCGEVALFVPEATKVEFEGLPIAGEGAERGVAAVVVGDLGEGWTFPVLNRAFRLLMSDPAPVLVALGMTRYWLAPDGLRLDTAPFVVALEHAAGRSAEVLGKPAAPFFRAALDLVAEDLSSTWMVGDDILGDVKGAQDFGLRGLLVRSGKFRPDDLDKGVVPDALLDSVAELPLWWKETIHV